MQQPKCHLCKLPRTPLFPLLSLVVLVTIVVVVSGPATSYGTEYSRQLSTATNECGNGYFATQIVCSNDQSVIQGRHNVVTGSSYQTGQSSPYLSDSGPLLGEDGSSTNGEQSNDNANDGQQTEAPPIQPADEVTVAGDPTIRVFPCCDDMPSE